MLDKQKILISYYNEGKSQRKIARENGISRTTVKNYIHEYEQKKQELMSSEKVDQEQLIADIVNNPKYDTSSRKKGKLTQEVAQRIKFHLAQNRKKRSEGKTKQQKKKIDIHEALLTEGFDIGYTTVCNAVRKIQQQKKEAFIRQEYALGESVEFDWGEVKLTIAGKKKVMQMSVFTTAKGDYRAGELYYNQKTENFLDCHASFFEEAGGVHKEMVYDNTRVAVKRFVEDSHKEPTEALQKLSIYYGFSFRFCNDYRAHEKGHAERSVEFARRKIFSKKDDFDSYEEAKAYYKAELKKLNSRPQPARENKSASEILKQEKEYLGCLPPRYDTARIAEPRADKYATIAIDSCRYSVPDHLVGQFIFTKVYPDKVVCYHEGSKVASHGRSHARHQWTIDISHYLATLKMKPGALKRSAAFAQAKPELREIYASHYRGAEKAYIELLELVAEHGLGKVKGAIATLEDMGPCLVDTEKVKAIVQRKDGPHRFHFDKSDISANSRKIMQECSRMLSGVDSL